MNDEHHVKLCRNGRNQAVRIPRDLELPGEDAVVFREGNRLVTGAGKPRSLLTLLDTLSPIEQEFPAIEKLELDSIDL